MGISITPLEIGRISPLSVKRGCDRQGFDKLLTAYRLHFPVRHHRAGNLVDGDFAGKLNSSLRCKTLLHNVSSRLRHRWCVESSPRLHQCVSDPAPSAYWREDLQKKKERKEKSFAPPGNIPEFIPLASCHLCCRRRFGLPPTEVTSSSVRK